MLNGLLKSKFYTKCKANVKMTKTRVESIKKKKIAVHKFLKNDLADLLRNGLDMNAYNRAEGLLVEQNMARCYELVENFCANLSSNISLMQKQIECPEECKEIVASLIYAAARFADLPELRDLRSTFTDRFGDSLQSYTNKEFMERLSPMSYTKEVKLQLLQDIANEFSIQWDSKALEQMLFTPPTVQNQATKRVDIKHSQSNKEHSIPRRSNPADQYHRGGLQSSSEDGSKVTEVSDDDDLADSKAGFRGGVRASAPPWKCGPEKSNAEEEQRNKGNPRSVRQRYQNNFNLKPPPGRAAPARVVSLPEDYDELAARILSLRGK